MNWLCNRLFSYTEIHGENGDTQSIFKLFYNSVNLKQKT